jgi:fucose 4-O-acetylase-like acetyltransferase
MIYILCLFFAGKLGYSFANAINELDAIIILDKLFINPIGAYWYLHNLFLGLLCIYLVSHFIPENIMKQVIVAGIIFYAISLFVKGFRFESILSLLLGYSMKKTKHKIPSELISLIPLLIILFVTLPDLRRGTIASIILLVLVISFLSALYIRYSNVYFSKWSTYIGKNTLIIMLIHPIFLNVFKIFMPYFLKFDSTGIMYLFFTTIFAITLSLSISKYMDKLKVNNIIFGKELYVPLRNIAFNDVDYSKNFRLNKE